MANESELIEIKHWLVRLTPEQYRQLKILAMDAKLDVNRYVERMIVERLAEQSKGE